MKLKDWRTNDLMNTAATIPFLELFRHIGGNMQTTNMTPSYH